MNKTHDANTIKMGLFLVFEILHFSVIFSYIQNRQKTLIFQRLEGNLRPLLTFYFGLYILVSTQYEY